MGSNTNEYYFLCEKNMMQNPGEPGVELLRKGYSAGLHTAHHNTAQGSAAYACMQSHLGHSVSQQHHIRHLAGGIHAATHRNAHVRLHTRTGRGQAWPGCG